MSTFDESKIRRANDGKFAHQRHAEADVELRSHAQGESETANLEALTERERINTMSPQAKEILRKMLAADAVKDVETRWNERGWSEEVAPYPESLPEPRLDLRYGSFSANPEMDIWFGEGEDNYATVRTDDDNVEVHYGLSEDWDFPEGKSLSNSEVQQFDSYARDVYQRACGMKGDLDAQHLDDEKAEILRFACGQRP